MQLSTYAEIKKYKNGFFSEYSAPVKRLKFYYGIFTIKYLPLLRDADDVKSFERMKDLLHNPSFASNLYIGFEYTTIHAIFTQLIYLRRKIND